MTDDEKLQQLAEEVRRRIKMYTETSNPTTKKALLLYLEEGVNDFNLHVMKMRRN